MHKGNRKTTLALAANLVVLLALAGCLLSSVLVTGQQLLLDLDQPAYYVGDQSSAIGNEPDPQDSMAYWALSEQSRPQSIDASLPMGSYQSPTLNEALLSDQLLERLNNELKRQSRLENEQAGRQELLDILVNIKDDDEPKSTTIDENEELKISPPVNNPLEFEAVAKIMKHLSLATNDSSSAAGDLISLDTLLSTYLSNLVKGIDNDTKVSTTVSSTKADEENNNIVSEPRAASRFTQESKQKEETTPASRHGSAEYIDHPLAIIGHQYVQGGAGEGKQLLGPDGTFENVQVVKTDHAVPSYCDPPNPCPIGFTAEDGCLENFINSASSSREYQAKQQCSCDNEHSLFNCASPISTLKSDLFSATSEGGQTTNNPKQNDIDIDDDGDDDDNNDNNQSSKVSNGRLETLARTIQNRFGSLSSIQNLMSSNSLD